MRIRGWGLGWRTLLCLLGLLALPLDARAALRDAMRNAPRLVALPDLGPTYRNAVDALVDHAARQVPIPAASGAFTYRFEPETGTYVRSSDTFGPMIFMERPQTIGRYVWNIGVTGQYLELNEFDGKKVGVDPDRIIVPGRAGPVLFSATPKFIYHLATVNVTYGLLDNLDLNVAVPLIAADFDMNAFLVNEQGRLFLNTQHSKESFAVGDVHLRAKYRLCEWERLTAAAGLITRFPSGATDNPLGIGDVEMGPYLAVSTVFWDRVEPQWNAGFDFNVENSHLSSGHYAFGVNVQAVKEWLDLGVAFLGRSEVDGRITDASISGPHQTATGPALRPYEGLNFDRKDYFDLNLGARVRLFKTLVLSVNMLKGLNEDGLRSSNWSPGGALEATF